MIPSARGVHPDTVACIWNIRTELEKACHKAHLATLYRMPLDLARNELGTAFLSTTADAALLLDDDVQIVPSEGALQMIAAIKMGCDIVSAPCRMRSEGNLFNVVPTTEIARVGAVRVVECAWTGLGAVMVHRRVFERMHALATERSKKPACTSCGRAELETYRSTVMPKYISAAIFKSRIDPARRFFVEAPLDENVYSLDDKAFSLSAVEAGFKIHAAIDVGTVHDGMTGCFGQELERLQHAQAQVLVGADGRPAASR